MPTINRVTNPDKLVEQKVNYFLDRIAHATFYAGWQWHLELESPSSLVEKVILRLKEDAEFRLEYLDSYFKQEFFTEDKFWDNYQTYLNVKKVVSEYNAIGKIKDWRKKKIQLVNSLTFQRDLEILLRDLKYRMPNDLVNAVLTNILCSHTLEELMPDTTDTHASFFNQVSIVLVSEYLFRGYTRYEIRDIISKVFSKEIDEFPFPAEIKTTTQRKKFMKKRTLREQLHAQKKMGITPGLYQLNDRTHSISGQLILKPDSTLLFFGLSSAPVNPCYTAYSCNWYNTGDSLCLIFIPFPQKDLYFKNTATAYNAETRPSYDSAYIKIFIEDQNGTPQTMPFTLGHYRLFTKNGNYETVIPSGELSRYSNLSITDSYGHTPQGGYFGAQLPLDLSKNVHLIKIKLQSLGKIPIMFNGFPDPHYSCYPYKSVTNQEIIFQYDPTIKRETDHRNLDALLQAARENNPTFKQFFDKIEKELRVVPLFPAK